MKRNHVVLIKRLLAYGLAANLAAQPAFAQVAISQLPLASAGGSSILPNLLFTLDNSGSMDWDFIPDYVNPLVASFFHAEQSLHDRQRRQHPVRSGRPALFRGRPVRHERGCVRSELQLSGRDRFERTAARQPAERNAHSYLDPNDAYGVQFAGNANLTTSVQDRRYCNSNGVCKRNGQDDASGNLVSGTDDVGHTMSAGVFPTAPTHPIRARQSSACRDDANRRLQANANNGPITVTTVEAHGLTTSDKVFVTSGTAGLSVIAPRWPRRPMPIPSPMPREAR